MHLYKRSETLARIIHEASTAAADSGMSTSLRSVGFLEVLSSTPAESDRQNQLLLVIGKW
jgi:hypothetical protein